MRIDARSIQPAVPTRPEGPTRAKGASAPAELRDHLSADELAYFAELERMGPLTYGRKKDNGGHAPAPVLGQRIDVKA